MIELLKADSIESSTKHIKFPDGTLIQMGSAQTVINESGVANGSFSFNFPISFIDDKVFMFCSNIYSHLSDVVYSIHPSSTGANIYYTSATGIFSAGNSVYFKWVAIGRWK